MTLVGSKILHYRIFEEIGAGGMGTVYLAEDEKLHRKVALKFVARAIQDDPNARDRLIREARAASRLSHPNIVAMHAIEETPEHVFIVMEYVQGESVRDIVKRGGMTWQRALELAPQILSALAMAHEHDVVHRDVKSDNIMLTPAGQLKVLDFGLARGRDASAHISRVGSSAGTPAYMSPEQVQDGEVDHRSDLFSFGVVLYEMATGRLPFKGEHEAAVTYSIVNEAPTPARAHNKAVPEALQSVITRLLEKNPRDRYQSAAEVIADLRRVSAGERVGARLPMPAVFALAVAIVAVLALVFARVRAPADDALVTDANAGRKMIAVLPFEDLLPASQGHIADAVCIEITTRLASISGLGVTSRTSAAKYRNSGKSLKEIGRELDIAFALEGSVREGSDDSHVRISAQLIRINDDTHVWTETFEGDYRQTEFQREIATRVAEALDVAILAPERAVIAAAPTENLEAYDLYMRARAGYERALTPEETDAALALAESAVTIDSTFAEAQAFLARQYANQYFNNLHREHPRMRQARQAALAAVRHSQDKPAGHIAMGYYHYYGSRDYERALKEFDAAERMQPNNAEVLEAIAYVQRRQARWDESVANLERAIALDPNDTDRIANLLQTLVYMRRWDDAERYIQRGLALQPEGLAFVGYQALLTSMRDSDPASARKFIEPYAKRHWFMTNILTEFDFMARDYESVHRRLPNLKAVSGIDTAQYYVTRASAYHYAGDEVRSMVFADSALAFMDERGYGQSSDHNELTGYSIVLAMHDRNQEALRLMDRAVEMMPVERDAMSGVDVRTARAIFYIILGDHEAAIRELEYLLSVPSAFSPAILRLHPGFDALREYPRFKALVEEKVSS